MKEFYTKIGQYLASKGGAALVLKLNKYHAKPKVYNLDLETDSKEWNEIYETLLMSDLGQLIRTPSGGIAQCKENHKGVWDLQLHKQAIITVIVEGYTFVYKIKCFDKTNTKDLTGTDAFMIFSRHCLEHGINLQDYSVENGLEIKSTIPAPKIFMRFEMREDEPGLENCHHIDFHNSYPAGLCNTHPEFRPVIEPIYKERKTKPENKIILNCAIGFMHSPHKRVKARWAHLAKDAIVDNNNRIDKLADELRASGRFILGYNTDGIWYQGEIFHGEGEGKDLGQWENDHINCIFRSKSNGAYEYIEDGKYHPVIRGRTVLDNEKDRSQWEWGDIYKTGAEIRYTFDPLKGITKVEVSDIEEED